MSHRLSFRDLLEGGLSLALANRSAIVVFVVADALLSYGVLWAEARYDLNPAPFMVLSTAAVLLTSLVLTLALGNSLALVLSDPVELFIRSVFGFAAWLIGTIAFAAGLVLLIVPGLYVLARLTIALPLILLDGEGVLEGLRRSWVMTERSAWPLAGIQGGLLGLESLLSYFGPQVTTFEYSLSSLVMCLSLAPLSLVTALGTAVAIFVWRQLSPPPDQLTQVFA